ncbi:hypothetical protein B0H17DRAFT_1210511 [Mycena rosella]|uniref:Alpha-type protein kinase domain-containing protein n=1 Tax=Mycena rosella TaxID=1033263 RepID=A0AAD7CWG1_MYCRO|nr:hypothetical protein B0H17DRAFT_1210511 [Mycena rosella]
MKLAGLYLYLEALILIPEFEEKTGCEVPDFILAAKDQKKRKKELEFELEEGSTQKRVRTEIVLQSSLPPLTSLFRPSIFEEVQVLFAKIAVDSEGTVTIALPDINEGRETETVSMSKDQYAQGDSQYIYKASLHSLACSKANFTLSSVSSVGLGKDIVLLDQNRTEVILEGKRLVQLGWFYAEFERRAKSGKVQIETLRVTECLLAFKLTPKETDPSVASGYKDIDIDIADVPMIWLMEPFRPGPCQKWSGTNQHPSHSKSAVGSTANAFAHFVYATSFGTIAVTDIQTSRARIGNTAADVMFDLTTHTGEGNSGVGDQHECVPRCNELNLGDLVDPDAAESDSEKDNE